MARAEIFPFPWGKVRNIHEVGPYEVVEYDEFKSGSDKPREYSGRVLFHPFVDGEDTNCSFLSLEAALVHAFAIKHCKDDRVSMYIAMLLRLPDAPK